MAIFHQQHRHICRGKGRSATGAAAYRGALNITDARAGITFRYAKRGGVLDHAVLVPENAPDWANDPSALWNAAEAAERYKNARVGVEDIIALPHELSLEENRAWLHGFAQEAYVSKGQAVQVDIHAPDKKGDHRNIHAHILGTPRVLGAEGFGEKAPLEWSDKRRAEHGLPKAKVELKALRELCAQHMNRALERAGHKARVDHRSFKDRGIERKPAKHLGPAATQMERRGIKTCRGNENRAIQATNRQREWKEERRRKNVLQRKKACLEHKYDWLRYKRDRKRRRARAARINARQRQQEKSKQCAQEMKQSYTQAAGKKARLKPVWDNQKAKERKAVSEHPEAIQAPVRASEAFSARSGRGQRLGRGPPATMPVRAVARSFQPQPF